MPSLTPIWRSAEFQEREIFDLYGIHFDGHPDLRRILMWDEFKDYPDAQGLSSSRTITNTNRLRTTTCWKEQSSISAARPEMDGAEKLTRTGHEHDRIPGTGAGASAPMSSRLEGELLEVSMGPQHPSTHGVFRMNVALDGEIVRKLKPVFGYLHRNHEKIGENTSYLGSMPYTDRLDYFCSMTNNWAYALSVEKLAGIEVPERAEYLRVILAELTRLQNHASLLGFLLSDMGAWGTPLMYAFREREKILDLFESLSGSRMMCDYMRFGGCRVDANARLARAARKRSSMRSRGSSMSSNS